MPIDPEVSLDWLVSNTAGYSGAEVLPPSTSPQLKLTFETPQVTAVCNEAALRALEEDIAIRLVSKRHFEHSLKLVKPRITAETIQFYEDYVKESGMHSI